MALESADRQWDEFIGDAAQVIAVNEELHEAVPALMEEPFDPAAQQRLREVLNSPRLELATQAAHRIAILPTAFAEGA